MYMTLAIMTTHQAAEILEISVGAVRKLLGAGELTSSGSMGKTILIDQASVERLRNRGTQAGRPWHAATAWAALAVVSGHNAPGLDPGKRYRLKQRLLKLGPKEMAIMVRRKDTIKRYRAPATGLARMIDYLIVTGSTAMGNPAVASRFGMAASTSELEGYVTSADVGSFISHFGLVPGPEGNVILHVIEDDSPISGGELPAAAIAVDLMDSLSTRERSAGERELGSMLKLWKAGQALNG